MRFCLPLVRISLALSLTGCLVGEESEPEEFGATGSLLDATTFLCSGLAPYHRISIDAIDVLDSCVAQTPSGGTLEIPAGQYTIRRSWNVNKPITIRTYGKTEAMARCNFVDAPDCAELVIRGPGAISVNLTGQISFDHIVVNGNKYERLGNDIYTKTLRTDSCGGIGIGSDVRVTNSVAKYVTCGTAFGISVDARNVVVANNSFAFNGFHHYQWADGLTAPNVSDSRFTGNEFFDNTDVQMIFGGCRNCVIQNNMFGHSRTFTGGSFAALNLSSMVVQGGSYAGTDISGNRIDCGPEKRCGFGIYFGNEAWNTLETLIAGYNAGFRLGGGSLHDNVVVNAQLGLNLGRTTSSVQVFNNQVASSGGSYATQCGQRALSGYNIIPGAMLDRSLDAVPTAAYTSADWINCAPNWATYPYGTHDPSEAATLALYGINKVSIACPTSIAPGGSLSCNAWGAGAIVGGHWTVDQARVAGCDNSLVCAIPGLGAGTHDVQVVAQTPAGAIVSNIYRTTVAPTQSTGVTVTCPSSLPAGAVLSCSATSSAALTSGYWTVGGARYTPCDNRFQCSAAVGAGSYAIQVVAMSGGTEIRSNTVVVNVGP